ncbi:MAG: diguanylate cyclase [Rubrivivax sp.]|nr:diguanylate cyclase [Rubrivivax sp.]
MTGRAPPALLQAIDAAGQDHPRHALAQAADRLAAARARRDAEAEFWMLLGRARVESLLEDAVAARSTLDEAAALLARQPSPTPRQRLWLEIDRVAAESTTRPGRELLQQVAAMRPRIAALGDPALACDLAATELWLLQDVDSHDEAWLLAEELERCGRDTGQPLLMSSARAAMARLAALLPAGTPGGTDPLEHIGRALLALDDVPSRFRRSLVEYDAGVALRRSGRPAEAIPFLHRALALSRELDDDAGIAAAQIVTAEALLDLGTSAEALPLLAEAERMLEGRDGGFRMIRVHELRLLAMSRLRAPGIDGAIAAARRWDLESLQPAARARLARALAGAHAAQERFASAYAELTRADELERSAREGARDVQVLRLQARYDAARREAENAELRYRGQASQLLVERQQAEQRALWTVLALLLVMLGGAAVAAWQQTARRRELAELALRDDLTGLPNRRAVTAYAQAQFEQARRLGLPLVVAVIDLDHFKLVNDRHGHAVGDATLRAFGQAARTVLREQDRLGRWGGEEWLLVMPGMRGDDLRPVFRRLREGFATTAVDGLEGRHGFTFSMGGAEVDAGTATVDALIAAADRALFRAKALGRDRLALAGEAPDAPPAAPTPRGAVATA